VHVTIFLTFYSPKSCFHTLLVLTSDDFGIGEWCEIQVNIDLQIKNSRPRWDETSKVWKTHKTLKLEHLPEWLRKDIDCSFINLWWGDELLAGKRLIESRLWICLLWQSSINVRTKWENRESCLKRFWNYLIVQNIRWWLMTWFFPATLKHFHPFQKWRDKSKLKSRV